MLAKIDWNKAFDIVASAEATMQAIDQRRQPVLYELTKEGEPWEWYLIHTFPGEDVRAFRWLARRRFAVFQPMVQRRQRATSMLVQGKEPMFPGWLFVHCQGIAKNASRIRSCPGVAGILSDPATMRPVPIDQPDMVRAKDGMACVWPRVGFIDKLRVWSEEYNPSVPHTRHGAHYAVRANRQLKRSVRKLGPKERKNLERMTAEAKRREIWDQAQWEQVMRLDPGARIAVLMQTIKSASDAGGLALAEA